MGSTEITLIVVALVCAVLASVMVAADAAFQSFSRARADRLLDEGRAGAARVVTIAADPAPYLNAALFARIVFEIASIVMVGIVVADAWASIWMQLLVAGGIMVVVSFILWGVAPRTLGQQRADGVALAMAGPLQVVTLLLKPITELMILIGNALTPGRGFAEGPFASEAEIREREAELREQIDQAEATNVIEAGERRMLHSVFKLGDTIVREIMVPRTDVVYLSAEKTLRQGLSLALRSGFSRIPVVGEGGLDNVVGVMYLKDVQRRIYDNSEADKNETVDSLMRKVIFCPDSKPVDDLLREMQRARNHIAIVVDEFGGTAGLVSIEDVLEEIVGEIVDEYDAEPTLTEQLDDDRFRISSRMPVDDLGELFGLRVDDDDVETVGGLMAKVLNMVPIPGSVVEWEGLEITAEKAVGRRHQIDTCIVRRAPEHVEHEQVEQESA